MEAIRLVNLNKVIKKHPILKDINLSLGKGKIYGFFGRNGSGKTMLFRAISGLIKPTSGEVYVFGKKLGEDISFPESLGIIIESVGFWPQFTGFENLKILASIKSKISDEQITEAIKKVGLDPEDKRLYSKYSLGMKQRLGIAQAIMEEPELIILDEPTSSLDEEGVQLVRRILIEEKKRGATILIASHNKEDIDFLSDEKFKMDNGRLYHPQEEVNLNES
ncbi:multidrug ABC transporter ATP-binding protein [Peptococcaceae bacterium SCADC1_2_3]|nr:multidrug ABC transporter ATP-binding protein [Peptococcaceae bacterium SCADC1_2_3]